MKKLQHFYLFMLVLSFNETTACKKSRPKTPEPGIEQCGTAGSYNFGQFFASLTLRMLDLSGVPFGTGGWLVLDALGSRESSDYQFFECIMMNVKNILRNYHEESLMLDFEKVQSELSILRIRYPPPKAIPEYKLENLLSDLRSGAIGLKPISDVRVNEHLLVLIPIWTGLNLDVYKLLLQQSSNKAAVKREMDVMIIFYSQLILRSWRKVRELSCANCPLCYQEYGPSPAKVYVPGLLKDLSSNVNKQKLQAIIDGTKLKDQSIISLRLTYEGDGIGRHFCWGPYHGKWLSCSKDYKKFRNNAFHDTCLRSYHYYEEKYDCNFHDSTCSEKKLFHSNCIDEQFKIYGANNGRTIKSGDNVALLVSNRYWFDISRAGVDGMYVQNKKNQAINLDGKFTSRTGRRIEDIYDGDIIYFGGDALKAHFQIFIKNSEMTNDPADLRPPGLQ